jgi:hypothetical protein
MVSFRVRGKVPTLQRNPPFVGVKEAGSGFRIRSVATSRLPAPRYRHVVGELRSKRPFRLAPPAYVLKGMCVPYQMIAERDDETVCVERVSCLIMVANAKVWASEGWQVEIVDERGRIFEPEDFDSLSAAA